MRPLAGLDVGRGKYLVFFVRVNAPTGGQLAGVSTRRLVQLRAGPAGLSRSPPRSQDGLLLRPRTLEVRGRSALAVREAIVGASRHRLVGIAKTAR